MTYELWSVQNYFEVGHKIIIHQTADVSRRIKIFIFEKIYATTKNDDKLDREVVTQHVSLHENIKVLAWTNFPHRTMTYKFILQILCNYVIYSFQYTQKTFRNESLYWKVIASSKIFYSTTLQKNVYHIIFLPLFLLKHILVNWINI